MATERDLLLSRAETTVLQRYDLDDANGLSQRLPVGSLEISWSTQCAILAGLFSAMFLSSVNATLVATLSTFISSEFEKSNEASWLGTAYMLAMAVIITALGTAACGFSMNMEMLIAARFLSGMGAGGTYTTSTIIICDMYSLRSRGLAEGIAALFTGLGLGLGGPVGGLVSDWFGWRWGFIMQLPFFALSLVLTEYNLCYVTPGKAKSAKGVVTRIDWGGSFTLLVAVGAFLMFLSMKFSEDFTWDNAWVIIALVLACLFLVAFLLVELLLASEPVLAPSLLKQRVPVLVGMSNFLVALCNYSVMYFFPMWFQTVALTSASISGLHLLPDSVAMSIGSLFAGWMMHHTGNYKAINLVFGLFPFVGIVLITLMHENSSPLQTWFSIFLSGFGNAVILQTTPIALLAHLPQSAIAVGTGFIQTWRGLGQVFGVAISSALFQSKLESELRARIHTPDASEVIRRIRHSTTLVARLPPDLQRTAREAYAVSLRAVFFLVVCATMVQYAILLWIPDKHLEGSGGKMVDDGPSTLRAEAHLARPACIDDRVEEGADEDRSFVGVPGGQV